MNTRWTSRLSLAGEIDRLTGLHLEVYTAIRSWEGEGPTREQLATHLHRKESSICGRVNELLKLGLIVRGPLLSNPTTGKPAETLIALAYRPEALEPSYTFTPSGQGELFPAASNYQ